MTPLMSFEGLQGNVIYIVTSKVVAFMYEYSQDTTLIWVNDDSEPYRFKGKHDDEIIAAIHGWEE